MNEDVAGRAGDVEVFGAGWRCEAEMDLAGVRAEQAFDGGGESGFVGGVCAGDDGGVRVGTEHGGGESGGSGELNEFAAGEVGVAVGQDGSPVG